MSVDLVWFIFFLIQRWKIQMQNPRSLRELLSSGWARHSLQKDENREEFLNNWKATMVHMKKNKLEIQRTCPLHFMCCFRCTPLK